MAWWAAFVLTLLASATVSRLTYGPVGLHGFGVTRRGVGRTAVYDGEQADADDNYGAEEDLTKD
ncbi:hypothetical protein LWP59_09280 [Amycolatopsis acidiphila]|uniref:Uncharacterized protein n=1 Tax=Amycolatopsis acidiphila TaxID=715473 RepID=A0A558A5Z4_9PSEU|nr:hypothetical protein [Amycolatopsis acidiphila]TVT19694.1 hypothetical protein FNH06_23580 [Amycolatopsis acidiphila]UIJ61787.1 hypothetical protein LWP59_09280 [Amycolatopsis acidiphila]GHG57921.1 hypothetical protein GCM10017788_09950 [Amycolatopsis acidiphila]